MTIEEQLKEKKALAKQQHAQWLTQEPTKALIKLVEDHEKRLSDNIATRSLDANFTPEQVRLTGACLSTIKTIKKLIHETESLIVS